MDSTMILIMKFVAAGLVYFAVDKFYFSKKEKKLYEEHSAKEPVAIEQEEEKPKVLDLKEEDTIFDDSWMEEDEFKIEEHEIKDPYGKKTLEDLFKENDKLDLDGDIKNLIN
ncbi:hypothetical protein [Aquimarina mytili]|uniref:Uncharacterized protein n=1 Tax=Aquimarina mytili TaxID=874423 RepID=A0A937DAJ8_9FLAO|nr:hypothetical protein [Aquimarina mytili]MBL0686080.1 hypothetical protein [Aquimarina mytili]